MWQASKKERKRKMAKKIISIVSLVALILSLLSSCHKHEWSAGSCIEPAYCYGCGEYGSYGDHNYVYGCCTHCDDLLDSERAAIEAKAKALYGALWIVRDYSKYKSITHVDDMYIDLDKIDINGELCTLEGAVTVKCTNGKYYSDDVKMRLKRDGDTWVLDGDYTVQTNTQPLESSSTGTIYEYYFTNGPTYIWRSYNGSERCEMYFSQSYCYTRMYNSYGSLTSSYTNEYTITHGIAWENVILLADDPDNNIVLSKLVDGDALIWDDMVFLLDS
jgi:hypothetical protein